MIKRIVKRLLGRSKPKQSIFPARKDIVVADDFSIGKYNSLLVMGNVKIEIAKQVGFREFCNLTIYHDAHLVIKERVFFNNYCSISCLGSINIGENTIFGEGVKMYDHNHKYHYDDLNQLNVEREGFKIGKIVIGKNCWIGSNVTILNNVEIGDNVIIGANVLVYKSIPANSIVKAKTEVIITTSKNV